jgi:hypothetical protein
MAEPKHTARTVLAFVLLLVYGITVGVLIAKVVNCGRTSGCDTVPISDGVLYIVTTIGGLVSALVVVSLAISTPRSLSIAGLSTEDQKPAPFFVWAYVVVWALTGLAALISAVILYPGKSEAVAEIGTTWLGLAVMGVYAYFELTPPGNRVP